MHVNFWRANLHGADLRGADFGLSHLGLANLQHADLRGANLSQVLNLGRPPGLRAPTGSSLRRLDQLPPGFDPASHGMLLDSGSEGEEP